MTTMNQMLEMVENGTYEPSLTRNLIETIERSIRLRQPLLINGQAGAGKTAAVYYVAVKNRYHVVEYNASDDLRNEENMRRLKNKLITAHDDIWIILLDEVDSGSDLKELTRLVQLNKVNPSNSVIIAITNNSWKLMRKFSINGMQTSFVDAFGANVFQAYRPYASAINRILRDRGVNMNGKSISTDLRDFENLLRFRENTRTDDLDFRNAFQEFQEFLGTVPAKREKIPQLRPHISTWVIKNGFAPRPQGVFRWHKKDFAQMIELLSFSKLYECEELLLFSPSFWFKKGSYKHPSSL